MALVRNVGIALASLLVFFGVAEAIARLSGVELARERAAGFSWSERGELYTMEPNANWVLPGTGKFVRVNELGLRGPQIGEKGDWQRILLLGDSVSFGYGVAEKKSLPTQLQRRFVRARLPVEVINAGVPGWCARQHRLFLEEHGAALAPDLVLATVVLNDIPELLHGQSELEASVNLANGLRWMAQRSALAAFARNTLAAGENPFARVRYINQLTNEPDSAESRKGMAKELEELGRLADVARELDVPFGLVLFPFKFQVKHAGTEAPQEQIADFAAENEIPVLDVLPTLRDSPGVGAFVDKVHLSEAGNEIVANLLARWLLDQGLIRDGDVP